MISKLCLVARGLVLALTGIAAAGWGGEVSPALDVLNSFAPVTLVALLVAGIAGLLCDKGRARTALAAVLLLGIAAAAGRIVPEFTRRIPRAVANPTTDLKVLTANVWIKDVDPETTLASILHSGADVVLLQETDGGMSERLDALAAVYPYRSHCWLRCSLTIFSKVPFIREKYRLRDADNRRYGPALAWARLIAPDGLPVTLITVHYRWPLPGDRQGAVRVQLADALAGLDTRDLILAGDMNLTPWSFAMRRQDQEFRPMVRQTRALFSWPARLGAGGASPLPLLAIDQLYAGSAWRQVSVTRLPRTGSDHYPVLAILRRR